MSSHCSVWHAGRGQAPAGKHILGLVLWMVGSDEEAALPCAGLAALWLCV